MNNSDKLVDIDETLHYLTRKIERDNRNIIIILKKILEKISNN